MGDDTLGLGHHPGAGLINVGPEQVNAATLASHRSAAYGYAVARLTASRPWPGSANQVFEMAEDFSRFHIRGGLTFMEAWDRWVAELQSFKAALGELNAGHLRAAIGVTAVADKRPVDWTVQEANAVVELLNQVRRRAT